MDDVKQTKCKTFCTCKDLTLMVDIEILLSYIGTTCRFITDKDRLVQPENKQYRIWSGTCSATRYYLCDLSGETLLLEIKIKC